MGCCGQRRRALWLEKHGKHVIFCRKVVPVHEGRIICSFQFVIEEEAFIECRDDPLSLTVGGGSVVGGVRSFGRGDVHSCRWYHITPMLGGQW
mgnify:CR=1 FL=1